MRIGVIGAGNWGKNLVRNLHTLGALAGVSEMSADLRDKMRQEIPAVQLWSDHREMLKTDIDAVVIATPVPTHFEIAREALAAGKDVFVEKPLALDAAEADELVKLADETGRILMVGHLLLYQPAIAWIKSYLESGKLGALQSLHQERLNLGKARAVENALWSLGVHDVAVMLHLVGATPTRVALHGQRVLQPTIEDDIHLHLEFPANVQAHLHCSWLWPEKRRRLTIIGSEGMLVYDEIAQHVTLHRKQINKDLANVDAGEEIVFRGAGEPLKIELEHFIECITNRSRPRSDGASGAAVVRVVDDATKRLRNA